MDSLIFAQYLEICRGLKEAFPENPFSLEHIEAYTAAERASVVERWDSHKWAAANAIEAIYVDDAAREDMIARVKGYFNEKRETFETEFTAAVDVVILRHGHSHTVPVFSNDAAHRPDYLGRQVEPIQGGQTHELRELSEHQHGGWRPDFVNGREALPRNIEQPEPYMPIPAQPKHQGPRKSTPNRALMPPLEMIERFKGSVPEVSTAHGANGAENSSEIGKQAPKRSVGTWEEFKANAEKEAQQQAREPEHDRNRVQELDLEW